MGTVTFQDVAVVTLRARIETLVHATLQMDPDGEDIKPVLGELAYLQSMLCGVLQNREVAFEPFIRLSTASQKMYADVGALLFYTGFAVGGMKQ